MVVDIPNHSFSFSLSPFFLSLFSLFSLFSRVQLSGRAVSCTWTKWTKALGLSVTRAPSVQLWHIQITSSIHNYHADSA